MALAKWTSGSLCLAACSVLAACAGTNNLTLQNPPAPSAASRISISFSPAPSRSISLVGTASITAVVKNDPTDAGVDWVLLCQNPANCGTLKPAHTSSGTPATYTPPASMSGNTQTVTVEAFASANHNSNVSSSLTVTGFGAALKGTYVFATQGEDAATAYCYQIAGVIVLDGNGNVTSGEQTFSDTLMSVSDPITGGSYYVGPDGRGTLTLNTANRNIGQQGIENLALVFLSNAEALIQTFDNVSGNLTSSGEFSTGTLQLQTGKPALAGGYAFVTNGFDLNDFPLAIGGIFNVDSPGTISGNGSIGDIDAAALGGVLATGTLSGTVTAPDSFGSVKINLTAATTPTQSFQFTGYLVDSTHIKLVENDINGLAVGFGATSGDAIAQGRATGTFAGDAAFAGTYVFNIIGEDPYQLPLTLASVGQFTADSSGNISSGYEDEVLSAASLAFSDSFAGTYTLDASGIGRVDTGQSINFAVNGQGPELIFYLTGNGNPPLLLDSDANPDSIAVGSIGAGAANQQSTLPFSFNGQYGLSFVVNGDTGEVQNSATGDVFATQAAGTLGPPNAIDINEGFQFAFNPANPNPTPLTGTFGSTALAERFSGTLTNTYFPAITTGAISVAFYPVDSSLIYFIETDLANTQQSAYGYFRTRTPVCNTCP